MATPPQDARQSKNRPAPGRNALDATLTTLCEWALKIGILALVLSALYLCYARFSAPSSATGIGQAERLRLLQNYALALRLLAWGAGLTAAAAAYLWREEEGTGYALALVGAAAYFLTPSVAGSLAPMSDPAFVSAAAAGGVRTGLLCLVPGALAILYDAWFRLQEVWTGRRRSQTVAVSSDVIVLEKLPGPALHCWQTHYCRPAIRELCPRFIESKPCWRQKEGCLCEEKIALRATALKEGSERVYQDVRRSLSGGPAHRSLSPTERRQRCRVCPIYAEHQRMKYKVLVPAAFAVTGAVMWASAGMLHSLVRMSLGKLDAVVARFSFAAARAPADAHASLPRGLAEAFDSGIVFAGLMAFLTIMLLTWLLRLVEYLVLKAQV